MTENPTAQEYHLLFGMRLKKARNKARITLEQMASRLGVSYQQVHKYESGQNRICPYFVHIWAKVTRHPVGWFF